MSIEKLTKLPPVETGFIENPDLPVIPFSLDVVNAGCAAAHAHPRGQMIYASSGTMRVVCGSDIWIVPSFQAVWVPPFVEHEVFFPGEVTLRNMFVDQSFTSGLPGKCMVFEVSPLLRELILSVSDVETYSKESRKYRIMSVIIDEIAIATPTDIRLPMATDKRLQRVMDVLIADPSCSLGLAELSKTAGAGERTLARLFLKDTGFTFSQWRKRLRLQEAVRRLGEGDDVTSIAFDIGYNSLSAFIKMFRDTLGTSPGQYSKK